MIDFNEWLQLSVQEKSISINRLQKIFGSGSEKRKKKKSDKGQNKPDDTSVPNDSPSVDEQSDTGNEDNSSESDSGSTTNVRNYVPNNGKLGHEDGSPADL